MKGFCKSQACKFAEAERGLERWKVAGGADSPIGTRGASPTSDP